MIGLKKKHKQEVQKEETFDIQKTQGYLQFQKGNIHIIQNTPN
jgi:hypothetical protein